MLTERMDTVGWFVQTRTKVNSEFNVGVVTEEVLFCSNDNNTTEYDDDFSHRVYEVGSKQGKWLSHKRKILCVTWRSGQQNNSTEWRKLVMRHKPKFYSWKTLLSKIKYCFDH